MRPPIDSKLPRVGTTIFTVMSRLAAEHGAINLSQGFPDFEPPAALARPGQRAPAPWRSRREPVRADGRAAARCARRSRPRWPGTTARSRSGDRRSPSPRAARRRCSARSRRVVRQGDEVVLLDPGLRFLRPGGRARRWPHRSRVVAASRLRHRLGAAARCTQSPRVRLLILNFPHNPSGATLRAADLDQLAALLRGTAAFVLSDEVYEHMLFDGRRHHSVLTHPELADRSLVVSSFGKTYHAPAGKSATASRPRRSRDEFRKVHQFVQFVVATPLQAAIADFMFECPGTCPRVARVLPAQARPLRGTACRYAIQVRAGPQHVLPAGRLLGRERPARHRVRALAHDRGTASQPSRSRCFTTTRCRSTDRIVRFCFAKHEATLEAAAAKLRLL